MEERVFPLVLLTLCAVFQRSFVSAERSSYETFQLRQLEADYTSQIGSEIHNHVLLAETGVLLRPGEPNGKNLKNALKLTVEDLNTRPHPESEDGVDFELRVNLVIEFWQKGCVYAAWSTSNNTTTPKTKACFKKGKLACVQDDEISNVKNNEQQMLELDELKSARKVPNCDSAPSDRNEQEDEGTDDESENSRAIILSPPMMARNSQKVQELLVWWTKYDEDEKSNQDTTSKLNVGRRNYSPSFKPTFVITPVVMMKSSNKEKRNDDDDDSLDKKCANVERLLKDSGNFIRCPYLEGCIRSAFFCDGHFNCVNKELLNYDESYLFCLLWGGVCLILLSVTALAVAMILRKHYHTRRSMASRAFTANGADRRCSVHPLPLSASHALKSMSAGSPEMTAAAKKAAEAQGIDGNKERQAMKPSETGVEPPILPPYEYPPEYRILFPANVIQVSQPTLVVPVTDGTGKECSDIGEHHNVAPCQQQFGRIGRKRFFAVEKERPVH
ncbi:unnamed protein product [Notodromas monacha]|uniref:Uncharacterized protein n=1 Tax=Notodromas monacha TaxID=399045 RepID=A0A7R9BV36_9CRUS|nr:unnamed protein product [Notodromas monacha]CAG0922282.1 unnamed protein product [Notodromas monacha]